MSTFHTARAGGRYLEGMTEAVLRESGVGGMIAARLAINVQDVWVGPYFGELEGCIWGSFDVMFLMTLTEEVR